MEQSYVEYLAEITLKERHQHKREEEGVTDEFVRELKDKFPEVTLVEEPRNYSYRPFIINIGTAENVHGLMHEYCHYITATPKQRLMINYGLGSGPTDDDELPEPDVDPSIIDPHEQEFYAGVLTIIYQQYYGYDLYMCMETMGLAMVFEDAEPVDDWIVVLKDLTEAKLITWDERGNPVPTFKINDGSMKLSCCDVWVEMYRPE